MWEGKVWRDWWQALKRLLDADLPGVAGPLPRLPLGIEVKQVVGNGICRYLYESLFALNIEMFR